MDLLRHADKSVRLFMIHKVIQIPVKILESFDPRELKMIAKWYATVQFCHSKITMIKW